MEQAGGHRRQPRCAANASSGIAGVEGAVTDGRSPAKRSLDGVRNAHMLNGLGLVAAFRGQCQSPSGGQDFTALGGGGLGVGAPEGLGRGIRLAGAGFTRNDLNPAMLIITDRKLNSYLRLLDISGFRVEPYAKGHGYLGKFGDIL